MAMEKSINERNLSILKIMFLFRFSADALFYNFLTRYFSSLGFSPLELGTLIAIIPFMSVVGNLSLSYLATSKKKNIMLLIFWTVLESSFVFSYGCVSGFVYVLIFDIVCCFCSNSFYNLLDTFAMDISSKVGKTYSSIRLYGSLAYVIGTALGGVVISNLSYKYDFMLSGALLLISGAIFLFIKFDKNELNNEFNENKKEKIKTFSLLKIKPYVFYMIFVVLMVGVNGSTDNLYSIFTTALKIPDDIFGYFSSATILMECFAIVLCTAFSKKLNYFKMMLIGTIALMLRLIIFSIPDMNSYAYLSTQLLRGITYGTYLSAHINIVLRLVGQRYLAKGIFVIAAVQQLFQAGINQVSPIISKSTSYSLSFVILLGVVYLSLIFFYISNKLFRSKVQ